VQESGADGPWRLRPWVLVVGAVVVIAVVVALTTGGSTPKHSGSSSTSGAKAGAGGATAAGSGDPFFLRSTTPAAGTQNVAPDTPITLTFSAPVSLQKVEPTMSPTIDGKWVQSNATTLTYELASPLIPYSQEVITIPGGAHGLVSKDGATLTASHTVAFDVAAGDTLRLQQLLAQLDYLPVPHRRRPTWRSTSPAPSRGAGPACRRSSPRSGPKGP